MATTTQQTPATTTTAQPKDANLGAATDKAQEKAATADLQARESQRDAAMKEYSLIPPDDYKARIRAQTHTAAAELHSDETVEGGQIINAAGETVNADGEPVKASKESTSED